MASTYTPDELKVFLKDIRDLSSIQDEIDEIMLNEDLEACIKEVWITSVCDQITDFAEKHAKKLSALSRNSKISCIEKIEHIMQPQEALA